MALSAAVTLSVSCASPFETHTKKNLEESMFGLRLMMCSVLFPVALLGDLDFRNSFNHRSDLTAETVS